MTKRLLLALALISLSSLPAKAQESKGVEQLKTSNATRELKIKLAGLKSYVAEFSQTVVDAQNEVLQQAEGKITLKQPDKMLWDVYEPNENTLIADGNTLWHIDPFVEQVVALDQNLAVENNPVMLLTNPDNQVWEQFTVGLAEGGFVVESIQDNANIVSLALKFEGDTLVSLTFVDRQRQQSELVFTNIQQNSEVAENVFVFSIPPGFDLDDQR